MRALKVDVLLVLLYAGSFAAASNLTGALEDTDSITRTLHQGGALSFWDYATAAPYVDIDMNPGGLSESDKVGGMCKACRVQVGVCERISSFRAKYATQSTVQCDCLLFAGTSC